MEKPKLNELALFAGAGGGILGSLLLGHRVVCAVEIEPYCREILLRRQEEGFLPPFPIWDDVRTFDGTAWRGVVDIVSAGFPCQPFSAAGKRLGAKDGRNMWPDTIRCIRDVRPRFVFLENSPMLVSTGYLGRIVGDLVASGYDVAWDCIPASSVGANHQRDRIWILAYPKETRLSEARRNPSTFRRSRHSGWWAAEPAVGRMAHGLAYRVDRLKATGNGQVPLVAATAWRVLMEKATVPARPMDVKAEAQ